MLMFCVLKQSFYGYVLSLYHMPENNKKWTSTGIDNAISYKREGASLWDAENKYGASRATLARYMSLNKDGYIIL